MSLRDDDKLIQTDLYKEQNRPAARDLPFYEVPTPLYLIDVRALEDNARFLRRLAEQADCRILLAQKAFSCYPLYPMLSRYLAGTTASGEYEARLGREHMGERSEVHVFSPAYREAEMTELLDCVDTIVFNSAAQWARYRAAVTEHNLAGGRQISCGLRINPGYSEVETPLYDPAAPDSRLGVDAESYDRLRRAGALQGLEGLHFHSLCEQNADVLERTLDVIRKRFGPWPENLAWLNLGGGHHITRVDYDIEKLLEIIARLHRETDARIYLEPGEAVALDAGYLVSEVLDLVQNETVTAIMDTSAACHMPDVLEMPYTPACFLLQDPSRRKSADKPLMAGAPGEKPYEIRLAGPTCLAGDVIGDYSFDAPPLPGDRLVFLDMAIYSMVKNNTFNGMPLPGIGTYDDKNGFTLLRRFGYEDFKMRLG